MTQGIRPYGPGKFDTILDSLVYQASLDGLSDEAGDVSEYGDWFGLLDNPKTLLIEQAHALTSEEAAALARSAGAILHENDQGFVDISYFDTAAELEKAWAEVTYSFEGDDEEGDD